MGESIQSYGGERRGIILEIVTQRKNAVVSIVDEVTDPCFNPVYQQITVTS
ncbi:MAG: hypothetical protein GY935_21580 [Gammaproteobacteria bacterium]|nr:hypothetical protein [Gammaproteobacteria bacterium]